MSVKEKLLTYEDIGELPGEGFYEVIEGRILEMAPSGGVHGFYEAGLAHQLLKKLSKKGYVLVGEVGLVIRKNPLTIRGADVVFISKEKVERLPEGFLETPPDLVVEILSKDIPFEYMEGKIKDYMDFGVGRILLIDPGIRKVTLIDEDRRIQIKGFDEEVEILPGLKLRMSELGGSE